MDQLNRKKWYWILIKLAIVFLVTLVPFLALSPFRAHHWGFITWRAYISHMLTEKLSESIAILLGATAIVYALFHDWELGKQVDHLRMLERSLSTSRKGSFPNYLEEIANIADGAKHLDVLADCLDYGSFFEPDTHRLVHDKICDAKKAGCRVRIIVGGYPAFFTGPSGKKLGEYENPEKLVERFLSVIRKDDGFIRFLKNLQSSPDYIADFCRTWFSDEDYINIFEFLPACLDAVGRNGKDPTASEEDPVLKSLLQLRQLWFAKRLQDDGIEIRSIKSTEPMFLWIRYKNDSKEKFSTSSSTDNALFTFANAARGAGQLGYMTHDPDLLDTFRQMFKEKWNESSDSDWLRVLTNIDKGVPLTSGSSNASPRGLTTQSQIDFEGDGG